MKHIFYSVSLFVSLLSAAQNADLNIAARYAQADSFARKYEAKYFFGVSAINPINDTHRFWYLTQTSRGKEFLLVDVEQREQRAAFDAEKLAKSLEKLGENAKPYALPFSSIRFNKTEDTIFFEIRRTEYSCSLSDYGMQKKQPRMQQWGGAGGNRYWGAVFAEDGKMPVKSPDGKHEAYIREGNLWVRTLPAGNPRQLSRDGSVGEYYASTIVWSPDSRKIVCCKYRPAQTRKLLLVASSPREQLQPATEEYDYPKPGDALPVRRPVLFFVENDRHFAFDFPNIEQQFSLEKIKWNKNSDFFTFDFNRRGHQQYVIFAGDTLGNLRKIYDEQSATFVFYSNIQQYWFKKSDELLVTSERDGWRHLYLHDTKGTKSARQLTKGEFVVKEIASVDEEKRTLILKICGREKGEDPYLEKFYSLDIGSGKLRLLTPENATHKVVFSADYQYFVDCYSRVDLPPTLVVRSVADGQIVFFPENQPDISQAVATGWRKPEVFTAKGRDGKTDIWGIIVRPTDFSPDKKYPIVEYIYAGPHDSHVPKSFEIAHRFSALAELGFITVMIDGMGTANRSKAFHDVCWQNLKDAGLPDHIAWLRAAAEKYPEFDLDRVGIYGGSAGGQNAMGALLFQPDFYKAAAASCGCHDNRMDKIWWNEQWMGYPIGKCYEECSNVVNASKLQGKLMLILGELDNNVDPASTLQVVDELIKHNKDFDFVMLPNVRHTLGEQYGEHKRRDFFVRHLLQTEPPAWKNP